MRKKIVVGNWKMNNSKIETVDLRDLERGERFMNILKMKKK